MKQLLLALLLTLSFNVSADYKYTDFSILTICQDGYKYMIVVKKYGSHDSSPAVKQMYERSAIDNGRYSRQPIKCAGPNRELNK